MQSFLNVGTIPCIAKQKGRVSATDARAALPAQEDIPMQTETIVPTTDNEIHQQLASDIAYALTELVDDGVIDRDTAQAQMTRYECQIAAAADYVTANDVALSWLRQLTAFHNLTLQQRRVDDARLDAAIARGMAVA